MKFTQFEKDIFITQLSLPLNSLVDKVYAKGYHEGRDQLISWLIKNGYEVPEKMRELSSFGFSQILEKLPENKKLLTKRK